MSVFMASQSRKGNKTNTRREISPQPIIDEDSGFVFDGKHKTCYKNDMHHKPWQEQFIKDHCPYGQVGDGLWIREEHYAYGLWRKILNDKTGKIQNLFKNLAKSKFKYPDAPPKKILTGRQDFAGWNKRIGRFMPKQACRSWVEITNIKIERLHDISQEDIVKEGIPYGGSIRFPDPDFPSLKNVADAIHQKMFREFRELWCKINGRESWDKNPWVWVVEFKMIDKPKDF